MNFVIEPIAYLYNFIYNNGRFCRMMEVVNNVFA